MLSQDCAVLGDIIAQEPDSIDRALERYERQRKPDVHALGTMDHQVCLLTQRSLMSDHKPLCTDRICTWQ